MNSFHSPKALAPSLKPSPNLSRKSPKMRLLQILRYRQSYLTPALRLYRTRRSEYVDILSSSNFHVVLTPVILQFEKVYVINLPNRTDKLDAIRLSASVTGFNFEVIKAVNGKDMSPKALPGVRFTLDSIMQLADHLVAI